MDRRDLKRLWKKTWHFIWEDDSVWSWIANILLAFILIKFIIYPGIGFAMGSSFPVVAVVSGSMEHDTDFDTFWNIQKEWYNNIGINKEEFTNFKFKNGFNKGDIMFVVGVDENDLKIGDVLVFQTGKAEPIIHRLVKIRNINGTNYYQTKGDHNFDSISNIQINEVNTKYNQIYGKAVFRIPFLGYVKIWFMDLLKIILGR